MEEAVRRRGRDSGVVAGPALGFILCEQEEGGSCSRKAFHTQPCVCAGGFPDRKVYSQVGNRSQSCHVNA